jgi:hypothetical protein
MPESRCEPNQRLARLFYFVEKGELEGKRAVTLSTIIFKELFNLWMK